jgi:DNA-binding transcriptional LysR family regulator
VPLYEDELVLVTDPEHRFAESGRIEVEELGAEQLILFDRTSSYHDLTSSFLREAGVVPRGVMEVDNIDATKKMVRQGLGVAILPYTAVAEELESEALAAIEIVDADPGRRRIVAIRRRDAGRPSGHAAALLDTIADISDDLRRREGAAI